MIERNLANSKGVKIHYVYHHRLSTAFSVGGKNIIVYTLFICQVNYSYICARISTGVESLDKAWPRDSVYGTKKKIYKYFNDHRNQNEKFAVARHNEFKYNKKLYKLSK